MVDVADALAALEASGLAGDALRLATEALVAASRRGSSGAGPRSAAGA